jgi:hypothetical protein
MFIFSMFMDILLHTYSISHEVDSMGFTNFKGAHILLDIVVFQLSKDQALPISTLLGEECRANDWAC